MICMDDAVMALSKNELFHLAFLVAPDAKIKPLGESETVITHGQAFIEFKPRTRNGMWHNESLEEAFCITVYMPCLGVKFRTCLDFTWMKMTYKQLTQLLRTWLSIT